MSRLTNLLTVALGGAVLLSSTAGHAAIVRATPATIEQVLAKAKDGDEIVLAPGAYKDLSLGGRKFQPELKIDARAATVTGIMVKGGGGISIRGGEFHLPPSKTNAKTGGVSYGAAIRLDDVERIKITNAVFVGPGAASEAPDAPYGEGYGVFVLGGSNVEVSDSQFQGFKTGVVMTQVEGFRIDDNTLRWMRSDGIQVSKSRNGFIERNDCASTRTRTDEHPDCIQMWSLPPFPPTSDVVIRGNKARGGTQGIGLFNHVRNGVNDGGFDRIVIEDNDVEVSRPNAITILEGRNSVVRNNVVRTKDGARLQARIRTEGDVIRCGNTVAAGAGGAGLTDPKC